MQPVGRFNPLQICAELGFVTRVESLATVAIVAIVAGLIINDFVVPAARRLLDSGPESSCSDKLVHDFSNRLGVQRSQATQLHIADCNLGPCHKRIKDGLLSLGFLVRAALP